MKAFCPRPPVTNLSAEVYDHIARTLTGLLPPPLDGSPEALLDRDRAAITKLAALRPANANEADLAAQCIVSQAQAEDVLRLLRENAGDVALVTRLNAQYGSMLRTSLAAHEQLMQVQAVRRKRESMDGAAIQDAWTLHVVEQAMLKAADQDVERLTAARPDAAPAPGENPRGRRKRLKR
jgi:hypothetical protein